MKKTLITSALSAALLLAPAFVTADTVGPIDFESPAYTVGSINGQNGWTSTGAYDQGVVSSPVISGSQSFRISNAVTSGSFGDQTFSKPLTDSAGETGSDSSGFPQGTLQPHFESQFTIKAIPESIGDILSVSPDTGNGGRMSYLRFDNEADGVHVYFDDVQGTGNSANFVETEITPALNSATAHTVKFSIDFVDGPSNDIVNIYIDGTLVHTGTSWENYYRFDSESNPTLINTFTHSIRSMLFRAGGTAVPANQGKGFLIDDLSTMSGPVPPTSVSVHIFKYVNGEQATAANANSAAFPMLTTFNSTNIGSATDAAFTLNPSGWGSGDAPYEASFNNSNPGADYATHEVTSGNNVVGASCADGKPFALAGYSIGDTLSAAISNASSTVAPSFTNLQGDKYVIVWNTTCVAAPPSTVTVTIDKFIDGAMATAVSASNAAFPMSATWSATNIGLGSGTYTLSPVGFNSANPYEAVTSDMSLGANYSTNEITSGAPVGATCDAGEPFALVGYSVGDDFASALSAGASATVPTFTGLQSNKYVIVWNRSCVATPPPTIPTDKNQCKQGGWMTLTDGAHSFKNQGDCVSFVATKGKNTASSH